MPWKQLVASGPLTELIILVFVIPVYIASGAAAEATYAAGPASFVAAFIVAWWWKPDAPLLSHRVLHRALVSVAAIVIYFPMTAVAVAVGAPFRQPLAYWIAHALKVAGGATGGYVASRSA